MKNALSDLNNHLFAQLERLSDENLKKEDLEQEIKRASSISSISKDIVSNATLQLDATKLRAEYMGLKREDMPQLLVDKTS